MKSARLDIGSKQAWQRVGWSATPRRVVPPRPPSQRGGSRWRRSAILSLKQQKSHLGGDTPPTEEARTGGLGKLSSSGSDSVVAPVKGVNTESPIFSTVGKAGSDSVREPRSAPGNGAKVRRLGTQAHLDAISFQHLHSHRKLPAERSRFANWLLNDYSSVS